MANRRNIGEVDLAAGSTIAGGAIGGGIPQADETTLGGGEVATQVETDTGTDDTRIVTPLKLANYSGIPAAADGETESVTNSPGAGIDISRTIPANTLAIDNESLTFEIWGTTSANETIALTFGSTTIFTFLIDTEAFCLRGTILRLGATSQAVVATYISDGTGGSNSAVTQVTSSAEDLTTSLALTASDAGNFATYNAMIVRKWAA